MRYLISFLEGVVTFISPCLLPMLPIYLSYFAAGETEGGAKTWRAARNALGFVLGFTLMFVALGLFFGAIGSFLTDYGTWVNLVLGLVVAALGLSFLGVLPPLRLAGGKGQAPRDLNFLKSMLFGLIFSVSWTPCVGVFLGSALALASSSGSAVQGTVMLVCFSAGLGVPFLISAVLIDRLKGAFDFVKRNYRTINRICGAFLVLVGVAMMTGLLDRLLGAISGG